MNYPLISEYVEAIKVAGENFEQLKHLRLVVDDDGQPVMTSGNFAVVFKMKDEQTGKLHAVKCFLKEQEGRAEAYRQIAEELEYVSSTFLTPIKYLNKELFVDTSNSDESEFPVLLMDWVEGQTLDKYIREHIDDQYELSLLAYQFSRLAMWLMPQPFAHGDLKPDNILVKDDGTLVLVDYDGMYVPAMKGQRARELGSPNFRHPSRTEDVFDEHIDDFSLVSILLSLKAIALQPVLLEQYGASDRLLFSANDYRNLSESQVMDAIKTMMQDSELATLYSLFILSSAQNNLSQVSFRLLNLSRLQIKEPENLSTEVTEDDLANAYSYFDVLYSKDGKKLLKIIISEDEEDYDYYKEWNNVVTDSNVEIICDNAFCNTSIEKITTSIDLRRIGASAFSGCSKLKYLIFPDSITNIGRNAFEGCTSLRSFSLPNGVVTIEDSTFANCSSLEWFLNSINLQSIGDYSFKNCKSLKSIYIPKSVRKIGKEVFSGCSSLESIFIPYGTKNKFKLLLKDHSDKLVEIEQEELLTKVTEKDIAIGFKDCGELCEVIYSPDGTRLLKASIDDEYYSGFNIRQGIKVICDNAFRSCYYLQSLKIPDSVLLLGDSAFYECNSLNTVTIPSRVNKICGNPFVGYHGEISCLSPYFKITNGMLFDNDMTEVISDISKEYKHTDTVIIPEGIERIGASAFRERNLISINLPNSLILIGDYAFCGCSTLQSVNIPKNVKYIGNSAFASSKLTKVELPDSMEGLGSNVFACCDLLTSINIPRNLSSIGNNPFSYCECAKGINVICNSISFVVNENALYNKNQDCLISYFGKEECFYVPNGVTNIGGDAFAGCKSLKKIILPDSLKSIGEEAFRFCTSLKEINIPLGVHEIKKETFYNCESLYSIVISESLVTIGASAFSDCNSLSTINLPKGLKTIDDYAFCRCDHLKSINLPEGLERIGERAFDWCGSITIVELPDSLRSIGEEAFDMCTSMKEFVVPNGSLEKFRKLLKTYHKVIEKDDSDILSTEVIDEDLANAWTDEFGVKYSSDRKRLLKAPTEIRSYSVMNGTKIICNMSFQSTLLAQVIIPNSVICIGDHAFSGCCLTSIDIPDDLMSIGEWAFSYNLLNSVTIPQNVKHIGKGAFGSCGSLICINVDNENKFYDSRNDCNAIIETKSNTLIVGCKNTIIPNNVKSIGEWAFTGCCNLSYIFIPKEVMYIGLRSFDGCERLKRISVDKDNESFDSRNDCNAIIETKSNTLIVGCQNTIIPNNVTTIGEWAFSGSKELSTIIIPDSVLNIHEGAFYYCCGLSTINLPHGLKEIGRRAFSDSGIESILIPNGIEVISESLFNCCRRLISVSIPHSVKIIENNAFSQCRTLSCISMSDNVITIGDWAFACCSSLTSIELFNSVQNIGKGAFYDCESLRTFFIPLGLKTKFEVLLPAYKDKLVER